ncbi:PAS domain-containing protein [Thermosulfuriphilus ammonigenes]|uniref:PAS domain-containing protein n=1 Tax=Thermosulfuriphilus ammonigenes TaxID=1936021 RepID=A0A6G7PUC5_9BACT|nr:exonuclease domain-containing protein [Thermosulfuriphilus ammonigenes]MBA2848642.1 DNA polymerase III epsilon subunit [Thermosulfuriphilus ammonigenes]QIJ71220.1 PAS domain-containing protein [Thermosulfuriphilus ammonigenes]
MWPSGIKLRTAFLILWLGGVLGAFWIGFIWLFHQIQVREEIPFYFLVFGFAYTFWLLFLMMLIYTYPLREIRRLAKEAEILVMENAPDLVPEGPVTLHSLEALAEHLQRLGTAFRKRALELEHLVEEATRRLELEKNALALILRSLAEAVLVISRDFRIVLINPAAIRLFGEDKAFLGGSALTIFDQKLLTDLLLNLEKSPQNCRPISWKELKGWACLMQDDSGRTLGIVMTFQSPSGPSCLRAPKEGPEEDLSSLTITEAPKAWRPVAFDFDLFAAGHLTEVNRKKNLRELSYTVFDTETTGLEPSRGDRIVAIGAVRIERGKILREAIFHTLVNPQRPIPRSATKIHGITDEMVRDRPSLAEVLPRFLAFCQGTVLVAHNAAFDLKFLELEAERQGLKLDFPVVDTLLISYGLFEEFPGHNLDDIAQRLGITVAGLHSALGDAFLTAEIFLRFIPYLERRGVHTLEDLFDFCRKMYSIRRLQRKF